MEQPSVLPPMPAPVLDEATSLHTPPPVKRRLILHVTAPGIGHQAKKLKMGDFAQEGKEHAEREAISLLSPSLISDTASVRKLESQSPERTNSLLLNPQYDPSALTARYEQELDNLRSQLTDLKAKIYALDAQIPIKDKQLQDLKEFIAVQHLQPAAVQGPDDSAVTSKFSALRYAITNLTLVELNGFPFHKPGKTDHKKLFARLTATEQDYKDYLGDSDGLKGFFFEGVIWTVLIDKLLSSPLSAFLGTEEGAIRDQVYVHFGASPQKYHAWRAYTADFLEDAFGPRKLWGHGHPLRLQLVQDLVELLSRYSTSGAGNAEALTRGVDDVVDKAVSLAWVMAKSRAYWKCCLPTCPQTKLPHGFTYQKEFMRVEQRLMSGNKNVVDLVGRPSLVKYGDSNGEQYDTYIVVEKAAATVFSSE